MPFYRFYLLTPDDHIARRRLPYGDNDAQAIAKAAELIEQYSAVEVWNEERRSYPAGRRRHPPNPSQHDEAGYAMKLLSCSDDLLPQPDRHQSRRAIVEGTPYGAWLTGPALQATIDYPNYTPRRLSVWSFAVFLGYVVTVPHGLIAAA